MRVIIAVVISLFLTACATGNQKSLSNDDRGLGQVLKDSKSEQRVALVIGNKDYSSLNPLKNPINDARAIRDILSKKKFNVIYLENASQVEMEESIDKFAYKLKNGNGVGLFYYAGHGMEVDGVNYLIPTDARIPSKKYVKSKSVSTDIIVTAMEEAKNRMNILILDSCRSNPFGRDGSGGLAPINSATGIYVAYATAPHKVAQDGEGGNGLFTSYLVKYINKAGLKIEDVFKKVRQSVQRDSNGNQIPWSSSSILGDFYFTLPDVVVPSPSEVKISTNNSKVEAFEKACNLNDAKGCLELANIYKYGDYGLKDLDKAKKLYDKGCSLNNGIACNFLGVLYGTGEGLVTNKSKAISLFKKSCKLSSGQGCNNLGHAYAFGKGIPLNITKAMKLYKKSCSLNYGGGCGSVSSLYHKENKKLLAMQFEQKGCDLNDEYSCNGLGVSLLKENPTRAKKLFEKACDMNNGNACTNLGTVYANRQDFSKAKKMFQKGCNLGHAVGCRYLGNLPN